MSDGKKTEAEKNAELQRNLALEEEWGDMPTIGRFPKKRPDEKPATLPDPELRAMCLEALMVSEAEDVLAGPVRKVMRELMGRENPALVRKMMISLLSEDVARRGELLPSVLLPFPTVRLCGGDQTQIHLTAPHALTIVAIHMPDSTTDSIILEKVEWRLANGEYAPDRRIDKGGGVTLTVRAIQDVEVRAMLTAVLLEEAV